MTNLAPVIKNVMTTVGKYKIEALPPFLQPTKKVMNMVVAFYEKVKNDVMQFYYVSYQDIWVDCQILPCFSKGDNF